MTLTEMRALAQELGLEVTKAVHLHDEDEWNEWELSHNGILVGSELVSAEFVRDYMRRIKK